MPLTDAPPRRGTLRDGAAPAWPAGGGRRTGRCPARHAALYAALYI